MARETLPTALALMFGHEGKYSADKADTGNYLNGKLVGTKYGITGRTLASHRGVANLSAADVKALSLNEAESIYRKSYWRQSGGDLLPVGVDYAAFDFGVNSGPSRAVKTLQAVVGLTGTDVDGVVGGQTVSAVNAYPGGVDALIKAYCAARLAYMKRLRTWNAHGRGWTIRVTGKDPKGQWKDQPGVVGHALRLAKGAQPVETIAAPAPKANPADRSVVDIVKQEPTLLVSLLTALGSFAAGAGPIQWALAAAVVVGVGYGVYRLVKRERANG